MAALGPTELRRQLGSCDHSLDQSCYASEYRLGPLYTLRLLESGGPITTAATMDVLLSQQKRMDHNLPGDRGLPMV